MDGKQYVMAVGSDDAGVNLKNFIRDQLGDDERVEEVIDFGVADADDKTAYPVVCIKAAEAVARCAADRAVLFGGTGLGGAIRPTRCAVSAPWSPTTLTRSRGPYSPTTARCSAWESV